MKNTLNRVLITERLNAVIFNKINVISSSIIYNDMYNVISANENRSLYMGLLNINNNSCKLYFETGDITTIKRFYTILKTDIEKYIKLYEERTAFSKIIEETKEKNIDIILTY